MEHHSTDVLIIGGGIIGVSLALELRSRGASVRVLERGEPGREASHSAAGMLTAQDPETPQCLRELVRASAEMYPEWVSELEADSGSKADLRRDGTIYLSDSAKEGLGEQLTTEGLRKLEPTLGLSATYAYRSDEGSVDPRGLMSAAMAAAKKRGVVISHEHHVSEIEVKAGRASGVRVGDKIIAAEVIVNCAGAWAGEVEGVKIASRPVKGQMLSVVAAHGGSPVFNHVLRGDKVYLVPRSDGRILIGATLEDAGFDKRVSPETILRLHQLAANLVPQIGEMRIHESWAGLRPGSPDKLPIMGHTDIKGYFVATGHYRNGILLAPVTARVMAKMMGGEDTGFDLSSFDPRRFH